VNERIYQLKDYIENMNAAGVRRTLFYPLAFESLQTSKGEAIQIRRAKAQAYILDHAPLAILPNELFVGSMSGLCPVMKDVPTYEDQRQKAIRIIETYMTKRAQGETDQGRDRNHVKTFEADFTTKESRWALMERVHHDADITYQDLQQLIKEMQVRFSKQDIETYEIGRELERAFKIDYGKDVRREIDDLPWFAANHLNLNYGQILEIGLEPLVRLIEEKTKNTKNEQQLEYYQAALIAASACQRFILRYVVMLHEAAETERDTVRKEELLEMAVVCTTVTDHPASSFREALQLMWLLHIMCSMCGSSALSFGRFDQYMLAYYQSDLQNGEITYMQAKELLCCMWLKINEPKMRTVQSLTLGGVTPEGSDAVNALTLLCLDVVKTLKLPYPNVGLRINKESPQWLYNDAVKSIQSGAGQPMLMNDSIWIENLKRLGYSEIIANDYYNMGCVEIMFPGKQPNWGVTDPIAFPMVLEDVFKQFKDGVILLDDFEAFKIAYFNVLKSRIDEDKFEANQKALGMAKQCYDPLASLMVDGCLKAGKDMFQGGSELGTHWSFYAYGLGTTADAFAAIKRYVYDEQRITMDELATMLEANFDKTELMQQLLAHDSAHYGNDNDDVDRLAKEILSFFTKHVMQLNNPNSRDKYVTTLFGYFFHIYHGEITGATANGRRKGEPFSDSMGPTQGKDMTGPTGLLNSVLKLNHNEVTGGYALNLKLNPSLIQSNHGAEALAALIRAYFEDGGPQLQVYIADAETLKKAKEEPDKYKNLIVRIGGYCEYFVNLDKALQDEIILRTTHGV